MTLKELARKANVSVSTASKALHYSKELHNDTIELVNRIARENGYFSDIRKQRQGTTKNKPLRFAVICPEIVSIHYTQIATTINDFLSAHNAVAEIRICNFDSELEREIMLSCLSTTDIDGVITLSTGEKFEDAELPVVGTVVGRVNNSVNIDIYGGYEQAVKYLVEQGHRKIGYIGENLTKSKQRYVEEIIGKFGLKVDGRFILRSPYRFEKAGYTAICELIDSGIDLPTAFIAAYDEIAMGAVSALLNKGIRVPDDVSVIGMNNVPATEYFPVPMTTVGFDVDKLCRSAVETIFKCLEKPKGERLVTHVDMNLIVRRSSGAAKRDI